MPNTIPTQAQDLKNLNLSEIATIISDDWTKPNYAAAPYLDALWVLDVPAGESLRSAHFYQDSADSVVRYFLANASTWRGPVARAVKAELRRRLGD